LRLVVKRGVEWNLEEWGIPDGDVQEFEKRVWTGGEKKISS